MRVKNATGSSGIWCGQTIASGDYYTIQPAELSRWQSDDTVLLSLANGSLIGNDGTQDLTSAIAIKYLLGAVVEVTKLAEPQPFAVPAYRTKMDATINLLTVAAGQNADIQFQMTAERYVTGGSLVVKNAVIGDYITAEVEDVDGVIPEAYRPLVCESYPVVSQYIPKRWVEVQGENTVMKINTYPLNAKITAGLYLCVHYYAVNSGSDRVVGVNYDLTKKL